MIVGKRQSTTRPQTLKANERPELKVVPLFATHVKANNIELRSDVIISLHVESIWAKDPYGLAFILWPLISSKMYCFFRPELLSTY